ncbi:hypothetical protein SASPL_124709 [Salvia splendens]|uniref:PLAC8 family protein n=1 Tax=Salvia splendens TaxID=180675 RepID=A0A8X8ZP63_SALSN|nr:cell number regulator 8-like [Salvia splendens]KAG6412047.1 hypothetical protein SASPL_124709 [Salvia splendens]
MANYDLVPIQEEVGLETEVEMKSYGGEKKHERKPSTEAAGKKHERNPSTGAAGKSGRAPPSAAAVSRVQTNEWESGIFSCLVKNDEFYSSDVEVCVLGCYAPCVLHGSNVERLGSKPGAATFTTNCLPYTALCLLGNCFFGWNCFSPCFAYPNHTAIRHRFNLEGNGEATAKSIGCLENIRMHETQREHCEAACDLATHISCHPCALCQEARELHRRLPHPGFTAKPVIVMLPPGEQSMGR